MTSDLIESVKRASELLNEAWTLTGAAQGALLNASPRLHDAVARVDRQLENLVSLVDGASAALEEAGL